MVILITIQNLKEKIQEEIIKMQQKLIEKYNDLAREAQSNGDKILSENYLQHADHFARILNSQEQSKVVNLNTNSSEQNSEEKADQVITESDNKKIKEEIKAVD